MKRSDAKREGVRPASPGSRSVPKLHVSGDLRIPPGLLDWERLALTAHAGAVLESLAAGCDAPTEADDEDEIG